MSKFGDTTSIVAMAGPHNDHPDDRTIRFADSRYLPIRLAGSVLHRDESPILAHILTDEPSQKDGFILLDGG